MKLICGILGLGAAFTIGYCAQDLPVAPNRSVGVYENEDLSGASMMMPISQGSFEYSAGSVCYALARDMPTRQLYADCTELRVIGAHIQPAGK